MVGSHDTICGAGHQALFAFQISHTSEPRHYRCTARTLLSGSPLTVATRPTDLNWLAIVSTAKRGAQSREAVPSRFAFRVALRLKRKRSLASCRADTGGIHIASDSNHCDKKISSVITSHSKGRSVEGMKID